MANKTEQTPAEGIMLTANFPDYKSYNIICSCHNPDDSIDMAVEVDEFGQPIITLYTTQRTEFWKNLVEWETYKINNPWLYCIANTIKSFLNGLFHRLKITRDVWVHGYVRYSSTTILSKQQGLNVAHTIINELNKFDEKS